MEPASAAEPCIAACAYVPMSRTCGGMRDEILRDFHLTRDDALRLRRPLRLDRETRRLMTASRAVKLPRSTCQSVTACWSPMAARVEATTPGTLLTYSASPGHLALDDPCPSLAAMARDRGNAADLDGSRDFHRIELRARAAPAKGDPGFRGRQLRKRAVVERDRCALACLPLSPSREDQLTLRPWS